MAKRGRYIPGIVPEEYRADFLADELANVRIALDSVYESKAPVFSTEIASAVTTVDISGLRGLLYGGYRVEVLVNKLVGGAANFSIYFNQDYTATNYYSQYLQGAAGAASAARTNTSYIGALAGAGRAVFTVDIFPIKSSASGPYYLMAFVNEVREQGANVVASVRAIDYTVSITDFTDIRVASSVANSFGVGSMVRVFRKL